MRHNPTAGATAARADPSVVESLTVTYIILAAAGIAGLGCFAVLILAPAWSAYGRTWERFAAAFLSLFVLAAFVGTGIGIGLIVLYYWDQILDVLGIQGMISVAFPG